MDREASIGLCECSTPLTRPHSTIYKIKQISPLLVYYTSEQLLVLINVFLPIHATNYFFFFHQRWVMCLGI